MSTQLRWAMVGTGLMADLILKDFALVENTKLVALVSRDQAKGKAKLAEHGITDAAVIDFDTAIADPDIDVIYVASPHSEHFWMSKAALEAGKHVLCEKAFTMNQREAIELASIAKANNRFLMEAMWTKFIPLFAKLHEIVASGRIGNVKLVEANFGFGSPFDPSHRLFSAELGGGTTLDQGVYTTTFVRWFAGSTIKSQSSSGQVYRNGCDAEAVTKFEFENGVVGLGSSALNANLGTKARIIGDLGLIEVQGSFWNADTALVTAPISYRGTPDPETIHVAKTGFGYTHMIKAVSQSIIDGKLECDQHPLSWTIENMGVLDEIIAKVRAAGVPANE